MAANILGLGTNADTRFTDREACFPVAFTFIGRLGKRPGQSNGVTVGGSITVGSENHIGLDEPAKCNRGITNLHPLAFT